jgi:tungstate transport system substrate-binding protein
MIARPTQSLRRRASTTTARVTLAATAALAAVALFPVASHADTPTTVTVVGTSDVFDSGLIQNVIEPDFEAAYPQYTLNYVSQGTGAAIAYAEAGTASALLVHAASLENQFVANGYSAEQFGRAIFYGDYVLLGPASDPAHVFADAPNDVVSAFEDIAAEAAANGDVNFVSRGGTPGTTVEEHQIWALTAGVTTCPVSPANGGGTVPSTDATCVTSPAPSWYHTTGLTQGPNVVNADACNYAGGNCYVLTDRGTYQYLQESGAISNLHVVTHNNSATAAGGANLLINSFHAYASNPAKFSGGVASGINLVGATAFLNWLTSPKAQRDITTYQEADAGGSSFIGDAAPAITTNATLPSKVVSGKPVTITGSLTNRVPGTPALAAVTMTLSATATGSATSSSVATAITDVNGDFSLTFKPTTNASYTLSSPQINQVEIPTPTLTPEFGDILQPTSTRLGSSKVVGTATIAALTAKKGIVKVRGRVSPAVVGAAAHLNLYAVPASRPVSAAPKLVARQPLASGDTTYSVKVALKRGERWRITVRYVNPGQISPGTSAAKTVRIT